jgi:hypothetical protein
MTRSSAGFPDEFEELVAANLAKRRRRVKLSIPVEERLHGGHAYSGQPGRDVRTARCQLWPEGCWRR